MWETQFANIYTTAVSEDLKLDSALYHSYTVINISHTYQIFVNNIYIYSVQWSNNVEKTVITFLTPTVRAEMPGSGIAGYDAANVPKELGK